MDFLSVDTEASELAILEAFDFSSFTFGAIFVGHNFTENREKIYELLTPSGVVRLDCLSMACLIKSFIP